MKMKLLILSAFLMSSISAWSQELMLNDGATITVQNGATLYVEGGIKNTTTGTIVNNGTIELKGNFENLGTWGPSGANTLKFSGDADANFTPSDPADLTPNEYQTVVIQKANNRNVTLLGHLTVNTNLDFPDVTGTISTRVITGNFDLKVGSSATVTGYDVNEYVATTGTGVVQRAVTANGAFVFPIGDLVNYSPLSSSYTGASYVTANLRAKANDLANPNGHPSKPAAAESFISRYWDIDGTGIGLPYANTLVGTYVDADENGTAGLIKGAVYSGGVWSYAGADGDAVGNTVTGSTSALLSDFTGSNFYGKVDVKVFLQGANIAGGSSMTTDLNPTYIPTMSPYGDNVTVSSVPAGVTDWVKIELRDATTPSTILGSTSTFIKSDGKIVGLDGVSLPVIENGKPSSILAVLHRNHLPFRTNVGLNVVSPTLEDFTIVNAKVYDNMADNPPLNTTSGKLLMWACDATGTPPDYLANSTDLSFVKAIATTTPSGYLRADVNLTGAVNSTDLSITKAITTVPKSADF